MLVVNVVYHVRPGQAGVFAAALLESGAVDLIRKEEGCVSYEFFLPVEGDSRLLLVERWKDQAALDDHRKMPHMNTVRAITAEHAERVDVEESEYLRRK